MSSRHFVSGLHTLVNYHPNYFFGILSMWYKWYNQFMNKLTAFILKKYARMSGEKKIRLGLNLSKMVRDVRKAGMAKMGA